MLRVLGTLLEALTQIDTMQIEADALPDLYATRVRYRSEVTRRGRKLTATEDWRDARTLLQEGHGDCEDLASYRAAWWRARGVWARSLPVYMRPGLIHCVTLLPDGTIEDPSALLGMRTNGTNDYARAVAESLAALDG